MSCMGSSRRAEIIRRKLDLAGADVRHSFPASCRFVRNAVVTAVPGQAPERARAEWRSIVESVVAVGLSCASLEELEQRIAEQSAALRQPPENAVVLSTIHSAKGLEWEAVLMVGMEDGVLPHFNNDDTEEERRVAYVGITRAKRISVSPTRMCVTDSRPTHRRFSVSLPAGARAFAFGRVRARTEATNGCR